MGAAEVLDEVGAQAVVVRGAPGAERRGAAAQLAHSGDGAARRLHLGQHTLGVRAQRATGLGEAHAPAHTLEQRRAELGLQAAHLLGERRLGQVKLARSGAERAVLGGGEEVRELLQIHRLSLEIMKMVKASQVNDDAPSSAAWAVTARASCCASSPA